LLEHTIADAYELRYPVYVSTDNDKIAMVAQEAGAIVIRRPDYISGDRDISESAISHVLETIDADPETTVVFMQCTSPFRKPGELDEALQAFRKLGVDSMFSCYELYPFIWNNNGRIMYDKFNRPVRQEKEPVYVEDGSFYISTAQCYLWRNRRFGDKTARWIHDKVYGLEIDTKEDLECARILYDWLKSSGKV